MACLYCENEGAILETEENGLLHNKYCSVRRLMSALDFPIAASA